MIRNFTAERQHLVEEITGVQQQLQSISLAVRQAVSVDAKLTLFTDRDRLLEQQHQLQVKMIHLDQEEIQHLQKNSNDPRFLPASR